MRTAVLGVFAAGDVNGKAMSAHAAYREAEAAINNILGKADEVNYLAIPQVVFTFSEAASVGDRLEGALEKGIDAVCAEVPLRASGRFCAGRAGRLLQNNSGKIKRQAARSSHSGRRGVGAYLRRGGNDSKNMTVEEIRNTAFPTPRRARQ